MHDDHASMFNGWRVYDYEMFGIFILIAWVVDVQKRPF